MKTLAPLEFRQVDGECHLYIDGNNVGRIAYNIEADRWEFNAYGQPISKVGNYEACCDAVIDELMPKADPEDNKATLLQGKPIVQPEPTVTVVEVHHGSTKPTYLTQGYGVAHRHVGAGSSTMVTVRGLQGEFDIWIPASFARKVIVGHTYIHRHDEVDHTDYLAYTKKPVLKKRQLVTA